MKKNKRSFKEFVADEGMAGIKEFASLYANENDAVTLDYLAESFNVSIYAAKSVIAYAIVHCIISYQLSILCKEKSHRNQLKHYEVALKNTVTSSDAYYLKLLKRRMDSVKNFDDEKVKNVVNIYIEHPYWSAEDVANYFGLSIKELNVVLKKAIIFAIVDDEAAKKLQTISLGKVLDAKKRSSVLSIFTRYNSARVHFIYLNDKIAHLLYQLESYDSFTSSDEEIECCKDSIQLELDSTKNKLKNFKNAFYMSN